MTTERQKARNLKTIRSRYGVDVPAVIETVYQLGILQGQCDEAFRRFDRASLDPRWRETWLRGRLDDELLRSRKLVKAAHAMTRLLMEEHNAERGSSRPASDGHGRKPPQVTPRVTPKRDAERARKRKK